MNTKLQSTTPHRHVWPYVIVAGVIGLVVGGLILHRFRTAPLPSTVSQDGSPPVEFIFGLSNIQPYSSLQFFAGFLVGSLVASSVDFFHYRMNDQTPNHALQRTAAGAVSSPKTAGLSSRSVPPSPSLGRQATSYVMETPSPPKGSFTIFHVWWVLAVFSGLSAGVAVGVIRFGWIGGVLGAVGGLVLGVIAGWLPWFLAFIFLTHPHSKQQPTEKIES